MQLAHFVRTFDGSLSPVECSALIRLFETESARQVRNGVNVRPGLEASAWTELRLDPLLDASAMHHLRSMLDRALAAYNAAVGLTIPVPNSPLLSPFVMKRYRAEAAERFQLHFDSIYDVCDRYLVFLWYLNDVDGGGATCFPQLGLQVEPRQGRLVIFPPYWMYQHEGRPPHRGSKYILSTYLRFPRLTQSSE